MSLYQKTSLQPNKSKVRLQIKDVAIRFCRTDEADSR